MIYNLVKLLRDDFPAERVYANNRTVVSGETQVPDRNILVKDTGGTSSPWYQFVRATVQIITRDFNPVACKQLADEIYLKLHSKFGLILPEITVNGETYTAIHTAQITAIQKPFHLGLDEEGREEYTTNYEIFYKE